MRFYLPGDPPTVTGQQKKVRIFKGKPIFYDSAAIKEARVLFQKMLEPYKPEQPLNPPVYLSITWNFPIKGRHKDGEWKSTRPDTDNLSKILKDEMQKAGFFKDDAHVTKEKIKKFYSANPGIEITVEELQP